MIPAFHPHSEALMSNLASRSHEWVDWEIEELLLEFPTSAKSRGKRSLHFRILLKVKWVNKAQALYVLSTRSSPSAVLLNRKAVLKDSLQAARILARRMKDSKGRYTSRDESMLDNYLTRPLT